MTKQAHVDIDLTAEPILIPHEGRLKWLYPSGRLMPVVSGGDGPEDDKKFTQADLDRIIQQRLDQWQRNNPNTPPADYDKFKADSAKLAKLEAENATELETAQARITALEADVAKANGERDGAKLNLLGERMKSAVITAAKTAANPDQVYALLAKDALTIGDDGSVKGAEEAVKKFLTENPHFVGKTGRPAPDVGQGKDGDAKTFGEAGRAEAQRRFGTQAVAAGTKQ